MPHRELDSPGRDYRILAQLGRGGMATILLAVRYGPGGFQKLFVIKQLRRDLKNKAYPPMFMHEARLAALLSHPNVVQAHEVVQSPNDFYLEMEYLEGQTLARLVRRVTRSQLSLQVHLQILVELLAGLHYAHELKDLEGKSLDVVHRDVSPGNLFLTYDGQVKLLDFGIAKSTESTEPPNAGQIKGKVGYMSPEQANAAFVDRRSDLYSVGVMLWEAVACQPFVPRGESPKKSLEDRRLGKLRPLDEICPAVDPQLLVIIQKALALDPQERFQTALELRDELMVFLEGMSVQSGREQIGALVSSIFQKERIELESTIARMITSGESANEPLIAHTLPGIGRDAYGTGGDTAQGANPLTQPSSVPEAKRERAWKIVGIGAILALIPVLALSLMSQEPQVSVPASNAPGQQPGAVKPASVVLPTKAKAPESIQLTVNAGPAGAKIWLDQELMGQDAVTHRQAKSDQEQELRVTLPGYLPFRRSLRLDNDLQIEVVLEPKASSRKPTKKKSVSPSIVQRKRPAAAKKTVQADKSARRKQQIQAGDELERAKASQARAIDEENPYQ